MPYQQNIHAIWFEKGYWTIAEAEHMMNSLHLVPIRPVKDQTNFFSYRLQDPKKYKAFITRKFPRQHLNVVIGFPK